MNKGEIISQMANDTGITKVNASAALNSMTNAIIATLKKGESVTLVGFGTYSVSQRAARNGRNPQTGEILKIKAKKVPKFKPGKDFTETIAASKAPKKTK